MRKKKLLGSIPRVIGVAALGMALCASVAHAAVVRLTFDPAFGSAFPNLGFAGSADINVDPGCLTNQGVISPDTGGCGDIVIEEAHVDLYNFTTDPGLTTPLETVSFAPPPPNPNPVEDIVVHVIVSNGTVAGLDTQIFGPEAILTAIPGVVPATDMWLQFVSNVTVPSETFPTNQEAFIFLGGCDPATDQCVQCPTGPETSVSCFQSDPAHGTFSVVSVPEPGTIALLLGGLATAGFARRRNRRS